MPPAPQFEVTNVASLARLNLTAEENELFGKQLADVLRYMEKLKQIDVTDVDVSEVPLFNVFRDDKARDWFSPEEALRNAPRQANGLFIVTKVLE